MKILSASVLALALVATPALAQQNNTNPTAPQQNAQRDADRDDDFDMGWLGLIGLLGLAGLLGRRGHDHVTRTSVAPGSTIHR
ncbi:WGxxGxxG family protein [Methylobacterium sp. R2-1]|uniref:WGxxGxxG family protein n=1 Tax=Methylobacterium sp. R2-1 TaxID=2587064 RepID=UPI00161ABB19|nr:WGxxGxxG family protein [Methylobacterium sp. R2-1]